MPAAQTLPTSFPDVPLVDDAGAPDDDDAAAAGGLLGSRAFWVGGLVSALAWAALTALLLD